MLPRLDDPRAYAIFLDLDGTLVEFAETPDAARASSETLRVMRSLQEKCGRALAVVSGREIDVVDCMLHPLVLPVAGEHGLRRRDVDGAIHALAASDIAPIVPWLEERIGGERGVLIERKTSSVALHYRLRPDLEARCAALTREIVEARPDLRLIGGKMVFEIACASASKGRAIADFLAEPPFAGRTPVFAGDDVTDEPGFAVVNSRGGVSIKVGEGETVAAFKAETVGQLSGWLAAFAGLAPPEPIP